MRETSTNKVIADDYGGDHTYECTQHGADEGFKLLTTVIGILGEAAGQGLRGEEGDLDQELTGAMIGTAVKVLCDRLDLALIKRLLAFTTRMNDDGAREKVGEQFNKIYQGNYGELGRALWFVLEHNYGPTWRARLDGGDMFTKIASLLQSAA